MSSDVQLESYLRISLEELRAVDEERVTLIPGSTKPADSNGIDDDAGAVKGAQAVRCGDKSRHREWRLEYVEDGHDVRAKRGAWRLRLKELFENNLGLLFIALSQFCASCMNVSVKMLNGLDPPVPPFELVAIRMAFTYVFSIVFMLYQGVEYPFLGPSGVRKLLMFRGVSGFFGLFGMYYSLQYLSLSDAVVLTFLTPTVTAIVGHFVLKEGFTRGQTVAGFCSLVGVVFIARPEFLFGPDLSSATAGVNEGQLGPVERGTPAQRLGAVGVAMLGVFGATGAVTSLRAIGKRAHTLHSLTYFSSYSIFVSVRGMTIFRIPIVIPTQWKWVALFFVIGFFGYGAQVTLVWGLQRETASRGMLAMYVQIIFAAILERIFFHVYPSPLSLLGTIVILCCAIFVALSKKASQQPQKARLGSIEEGDVVATRTPSMDSLATDVAEDSAGTSVTVLGMADDAELHTSEGGKRVK